MLYKSHRFSDNKIQRSIVDGTRVGNSGKILGCSSKGEQISSRCYTASEKLLCFAYVTKKISFLGKDVIKLPWIEGIKTRVEAS